jgi:hypothetical protein
MYPFWKLLKDRGFISDKKFTRLVRSTPLTDKELSEFVARQVVETQQSTKAIANLMKEYYPNTRPVYSKAKNVSDFRDKFEFVKFRELNNLHHAKDAYLNILADNLIDKELCGVLGSIDVIYGIDVIGDLLTVENSLLAGSIGNLSLILLVLYLLVDNVGEAAASNIVTHYKVPSSLGC